MEKKAGSIDLTPTWTEVARLYTRLAESGERNACAGMSSEIIRAGKFSDALSTLLPHLSKEQTDLIRGIITGD
jgi:hypothetical protein